MTTATYVVEADWDRDGLFAHAESDITGDVVRFETERGRDFASQLVGRSLAGKATVELRNYDGKWSRANAASALYGLLEPGVPIRIRTSAPTAKTLWYGFLRGVTGTDQEVGAERNVVLTAYGVLARLRAQTRVTVTPRTSITTGTALGLVLDAADWSDKLHAYLVSLSPSGYWPLDETSGNALDYSGNGNDGTVTIGAGTQGAAALDDAGGGSLDFDGADTLVAISDDAALQNIFDGGGTLMVLIKPRSDGEGNTGRIASKGWQILVQSEAGGMVGFEFAHSFSGTTGSWDTAVALTVDTVHLMIVDYDNSSVANNPTIYWYDVAADTFTTLTVGSGLTEVSTPVGTRTTDVGTGLTLGNLAAGTRTFDGPIAKVAVWQGTSITLAQAKGIAVRTAVAPRYLDGGQTTMGRWHVEDMHALDAATDLEDTEGGFLYESGGPSVTFEDRHHRLSGAHLTSQATFSDAAGAALPYRAIRPRDVQDEIFNSVQIHVHFFTEQAEAILWTLGSTTTTVGPGDSVVVWALYDSTGDHEYVSAWTTPVVGTDITQTGVSNSDLAVAVSKFSKSMKITITNNHASATATLTLVQAKGTAVTEDDEVLVTAEDAASITKYGTRTYAHAGHWHPSLSLAQSMADWWVSRYATPLEPQPVDLVFQATASAGLMTQALTRELSDRITVVATNTAIGGANLGLSGDYFIEAITHRVSEFGLMHVVEWKLSPAGGDSGYWILGEAGFSEIGETTRISPP